MPLNEKFILPLVFAFILNMLQFVAMKMQWTNIGTNLIFALFLICKRLFAKILLLTSYVSSTKYQTKYFSLTSGNWKKLFKTFELMALFTIRMNQNHLTQRKSWIRHVNVLVNIDKTLSLSRSWNTFLYFSNHFSWNIVTKIWMNNISWMIQWLNFYSSSI